MKANNKWGIFAIFGIAITFLMISGSVADGIHYTVRNDEKELFNNWNVGGVSNGPSSNPSFTISSPAVITYVDTYHWNYGKGKKPGTIALKHSDGTIYGPWDAYSPPGSTIGIYWTVEPNVKIKAGTYQIIDSDPKTWSYNSQSKNQGFAAVKTLKSSGSSVSPTEPTKKVTNAEKYIGTWDVLANKSKGKLIITSVSGTSFAGSFLGDKIVNAKIVDNKISFRRDYGWGHQDYIGTITETASGGLIMEGTFDNGKYRWKATKP